jgi:prepilin-type N-terminal cleavage/methylation domain-containing protein
LSIEAERNPKKKAGYDLPPFSCRIADPRFDFEKTEGYNPREKSTFSRFPMRFTRSGSDVSTSYQKAFTLVELLVAVSIVATLAVVAVAYGNTYKESQYNERRLADVGTLETAADSYFAAKNEYPEPTANRIYYDQNGAYAHSATGAYGVSSVATSDLFGSDFLPNLPLDPATDSPYAYGKRKDGTAGYDFAGVDRRARRILRLRPRKLRRVVPPIPRSRIQRPVLRGRRKNRPPPLQSLRAEDVRENRLLERGGQHRSRIKTLTGELTEGDNIVVPVGAFAILSLSDGSEVRVGSDTFAFRTEARKPRIRGDEGALYQGSARARRRGSLDQSSETPRRRRG